MLKTIATIKKEILLLCRDLPGLAILFIMPVLLIMVVTLAQEKAIKNQLTQASLLVLDQSSTDLSKTILTNIQQSGFFTISILNKDALSKEDTVRILIANGKHTLGLILYPHDSAVTIWVDPALQPAYKNSLVQSLNYFIRASQSQSAMENFLLILSGNDRQMAKEMMMDGMKKLPAIKTSVALHSKSGLNPSPIQNNVPGFILFAMFFIVIPLSGSMINEKNEGTFQRLGTLPVPFSLLISAKVIVYLMVCLIQFLMMMAVGLWIFPTFFGLPALEIGQHYFGIIVATICAALAAIGFGVLVGSFSTTHNQAAMFGSVMVVLLGTISGTFLPIHVMPQAIQWISHVSPMRWGIDIYITLFIREGQLADILMNLLLLLSFFGLAMMISMLIFAKRK